jgi:hypothetical protein
MKKLFSLFSGKVKDDPQKEEWDPERKLDKEMGFGKHYNLTESVALAVDLYFRAKYGALDENEQSLICIDPEWLNKKCEIIAPDPINHDSSGDSRLIYIGPRADYDVAYRVVVCRRGATEKWQVAGFHYPRDEKGHFYAVFLAHHFWFQWWESPQSSRYLSPLVNPGY